MFLNQVKDKVVYQVSHKDLDGAACLVTSIFLNSEYSLFKDFHFSIITNSGFQKEMLSNRKVLLADIIIFTDISPDASVFKYLDSINKPYILIDHHIGVYEEFSKILEIGKTYFFSDKYSGSKLLMDLYEEGGLTIKPILKDYNNLVSIYDTWQKNDELFEKGKNLSNSMYGFLPYELQGKISDEDFYSYYLSYMLNKLQTFRGDTYTFDRKEMDIIRKAKEKETRYYKSALKTKKERIDGEGNLYCYFEAPSKISFIASKLLEGNKNYRYVVCRSNFWKNKDLKFSLRSVEGGADVSEIARKWGGNGHTESAGIDLTDFKLFENIREGRVHLL